MKHNIIQMTAAAGLAIPHSINRIFQYIFDSWLARLVGLPNGHVAADGSPGRTDDGRVVRDFKLEPTTHDFKAVRRFRGWCIGSREGVFWF